MALDKSDGFRRAVGITMLSLHLESDLAGQEEKTLAVTVFEAVVKPKLDIAVKELGDAAKVGEGVLFVVADDPPDAGDDHPVDS